METPIADYITSKREAQIGKLYQDAEHAKIVLERLAKMYEKFEDRDPGAPKRTLLALNAVPDAYKLSFNQMIILAASCWLDKQGKDEFYKLIRDQKKEKQKTGEPILKLDDVKAEVLKIGRAVRPEYEPILPLPSPLSFKEPPKKRVHKAARREAPTLTKEQFAAKFDALLALLTPLEKMPYGKGRTWLLTQFFEDLKGYKGNPPRTEMCNEIASAAKKDFGHQLYLALNNITDGNLLDEAFDVATMNEDSTKQIKGILREDMLKAVAHYAFPEDEARRQQCEEFLKPDRFRVPDAIVSDHKSKSMEKIREERGSNWGTVAGQRRSKKTDDIPQIG